MMKRLDLYYRALCAYRGVTADPQCVSLRGALAGANAENDGITVSTNICTVESDWMDAIEEGLAFVERAIGEDRQFIHANGEVMPIEKVKNVSKESVQHLARHSNLITKQREDGNMIPDRLYSVQKLNDYAVYENRFLYMLLCYLRDFITVRYEKVVALSSHYDGVLHINKQLTYRNQRIAYTVDLHDERKNDKLLLESNPAKEAIERMALMLKAVISLLSTPLMEAAGKAPRLKPPITKTNVLKMDNHFKGAMALYEYIVSYEGLGYSVERKEVRLAPFSDALADEISEAGTMLLFLMYEYGLDLNGTLKERFIEVENRERADQLRRKEQHIVLLKKKLGTREITPEQYIAEQEEYIRLLESDNRRIPSMKALISELTEKDGRSQAELQRLGEENLHLVDIQAEAESVHEREKAELRAQNAAEMAALSEAYEERIRENGLRYEENMRLREQDFDRERETHARDMQALRDHVRMTESMLAQTVEQRDGFAEQTEVCQARIRALQAESGVPVDGDAFTDREAFRELERELESFVRFYEQRWGITKRSIRKKLLNYQSLKEKNGQK